MIAPQFKTWYVAALMHLMINKFLFHPLRFYVYKNNSVNDEFRRTLSDYFLADVKDIEKYDYNFDSTRSDQYQESPTNSKDVLQFEDLKNSVPDEKTGEVEGFDTLKIADDNSKVDQAIADYDQIEKDEKSKISKFDKEIDDQQYVEKSEIVTEEITTLAFENDVTNDSEGPEKISLPTKKFADDSAEIMEAQENRNFVNRVI
jgi:hypothetical protein